MQDLLQVKHIFLVRAKTQDNANRATEGYVIWVITNW